MNLTRLQESTRLLAPPLRLSLRSSENSMSKDRLPLSIWILSLYTCGSFSANCWICSCSQSRHMDFNFPYKYGLGISSLMKHASKGCADLVMQLCAYDPDERLSAKHALRHPYFKDLRWAQQEHCPVLFGVHGWDSVGYTQGQFLFQCAGGKRKSAWLVVWWVNIVCWETRLIQPKKHSGIVVQGSSLGKKTSALINFFFDLMKMTFNKLVEWWMYKYQTQENVYVIYLISRVVFP